MTPACAAPRRPHRGTSAPDLAGCLRTDQASGSTGALGGMSLKVATQSDLPAIWAILQQAIEHRRLDGSAQWQNGHPDERTARDDIAAGQGYVTVDGNTILAYAAVIFAADPAYAAIDGKWLTSDRYAVVHRVARADIAKGKRVAPGCLNSWRSCAVRTGSAASAWIPISTTHPWCASPRNGITSTAARSRSRVRPAGRTKRSWPTIRPGPPHIDMADAGGRRAPPRRPLQGTRHARRKAAANAANFHQDLVDGSK